MKKIISTLFICILLFSCKKEEETSYQIEYNNSSNHTIKIKPLYFQYLRGKDSIVLAPHTTFNDISKSSRGISDPLLEQQFILSDSIEVTYNDTLTVFHGSTMYYVNRDLRKLESYKYDDKTEKNHMPFHYYTYTFTNSDFEEAKTK